MPQKKIPLRLPVGAVMIIGFFLTILIGFLFLLLPVSQKEPVGLVDLFFVATSAVCVTGLTPVDISQVFTVFGQIVVMSMFQIGGLGFAVIVVFVLHTVSFTRFSAKNLVRESLGFSPSAKIGKILKYTLLSTLIIELAGAFFLFLSFRKFFPFGEAVFKSVFHSISAYNNAGFDLFSTSLISYNSNPLVLITVAVLIVLGGTGYIVYYDLLMYRRKRHLSLHTKIVFLMTSLLLVMGTVFLKFTEKESWLISFFHSVSCRTAGFFASDLTSLSSPGILVMIFLMFIGASPGSTGGGIKTTTFYTILSSTTKIFRGGRTTIFNRTISKDSVTKAFGLFSLALAIILFAFFLLTVTEEGSFSALLFETVSAYATVGLTVGITPELSFWGKIIIICVMFIGRVGAISIITSINYKHEEIYYPEERVCIG